MSVDKKVIAAAWPSLQKFSKQFPGLIEAIQYIGEIGSLDQAADETQARLDKLRAEEAEWPGKMEAHRAEIERVSVDSHAAAVSAAGEISSEAEKTMAAAAALMEDARRQAEATIAAARGDAEQVVSDAKAATASVKQELANIKKASSDARSLLSDLESEIANRQSVLDNINAGIAELKARL